MSLFSSKTTRFCDFCEMEMHPSEKMQFCRMCLSVRIDMAHEAGRRIGWTRLPGKIFWEIREEQS
jgi:hypothetical protein